MAETHTDPDLERRIREKIKYIRAHRKAIRDVARELTGSVPGYLRHHDMDKIRLLRQGMDPKEVSRVHRAHSPHHPGSDADHYNYDEMIFDWESARRTKPDKQLNAYETMMAYHPELQDVLLPRMRELGLVKDSSDMSRDRIQAQYARHPQSSLDVLSKRLAKTKWGKRDVAREDAAHAEEFGITGEDKEYLDRYIIARIAEHHDRKAKCKQAIMRALWEKSHNGESFDAALPARMARFRQYEGSPFGNYPNPIEQKKWEEWRDKPEEEFSKDWENYLNSK